MATRFGDALARLALRLIPAVFIAVLFVWPVLALVRRGMSDAGDAEGGISGILERTHAWHLLAVTVGQAAASTQLALVVSIPIVWLYARVGGAAALVLAVVVTVPFVLPTVVVGITFRALLSGPLDFLGIGSGLGAVLMAHAFLNVAVVVRVVGASWRSLDPRVADVARTLGASRVRAFTSVVLPRLLPAVAGSAGLVFLFCSTSFGVIIILGAGQLQTLETEIYSQAIGYFRIPEAVVLSMVQIAVVVAALILARMFTNPAGSGAGGISGRYRNRAEGRWIRVATVGAALWTGLLLLGPIVVLAIRSVRPESGGAWTFDGYRALGRPVNGITPLDTLRYSLTTALLAMVIALVVGVLAALALHSSRGAVGAIANVIAMIPLGISAVTLGFGYLIVLATMPYEIAASPAVIPCVQALIAIPLVIRVMVPALESIPPRLRDAAASLGARPVRVFVDVDLPVIGRSLTAAGGFAFVMALGEFGAASFLRRADTTTLPVLIGSELSRPGADNLATAMAASMILVAATTIAVVGVEVFRPRDGVLI
ncbi:iron ABC transporter permease [Gordonia sp. NPDC003585]|uniref:ABC transporter permease n=1 Tax=Gordonia sp. NPDC003585 TaxID=3154275 RepID=UPI0033B238A1